MDLTATSAPKLKRMKRCNDNVGGTCPPHLTFAEEARRLEEERNEEEEEENECITKIGVLYYRKDVVKLKKAMVSGANSAALGPFAIKHRCIHACTTALTVLWSRFSLVDWLYRY